MHLCCVLFFFLMIRRPPRSTLDRSSAASDVYKRQDMHSVQRATIEKEITDQMAKILEPRGFQIEAVLLLSLIHISEPTRPY